jgi:Zn-dependent membrane protease YugP
MSGEIGKSTLLTAGVGLITLGVQQLEAGQLLVGVVLAAFGLCLIAVYTFLVEQQASNKAVRKLVDIYESRGDDFD